MRLPYRDFYRIHCADILHSKGHGNLSNSGISTPFTAVDSSTPTSDTAVESSAELPVDQKLESVTEKLQRKRSFGKAILVSTLPTQTVSDGPTKEHIEQGRVKKDVYIQYIQAASRAGFIFFVVLTVLIQLASLAANYTLRAWGEHNREAGSNKGVGLYLLGYGVFSLLSTVLGAISTIVIWVYCAVRSSQYLHDAVSWLFGRYSGFWSNEF